MMYITYYIHILENSHILCLNSKASKNDFQTPEKILQIGVLGTKKFVNPLYKQPEHMIRKP